MAAFVVTGGVVQDADRIVGRLSRSVGVEALEGVILLLARIANTRDQAQLIREAIYRVSESRLALRRNRVATRKQSFRRTAGRVDRTRAQHLQTAEVGQLIVVVATECPVQLLERGTVQADFLRELALRPSVIQPLGRSRRAANLDGVLTDITAQARDG